MAGQAILAGKPISSTHIFVAAPLLTSATYILLLAGLYAINTLKKSGNWGEKLQFDNRDGAKLKGLLISENAGAPAV